MTVPKDPFILTRKKREYAQATKNPKISVDQQTYQALQRVAYETGLSISEISKTAIEFALDRLTYTEE